MLGKEKSNRSFPQRPPSKEGTVLSSLQNIFS